MAVKRYILKTKYEIHFVEVTKAIYESQLTSPQLGAKGRGLGMAGERVRPREQKREALGKVPSEGWKCQWAWSSSRRCPCVSITLHWTNTDKSMASWEPL